MEYVHQWLGDAVVQSGNDDEIIMTKDTLGTRDGLNSTGRLRSISEFELLDRSRQSRSRLVSQEALTNQTRGRPRGKLYSGGKI